MNMSWYPQIAVDTEAGMVTGTGGGPYYDLVARHSDKCVDVSDNFAADGAVALQYTCGGGLNQRWRLRDAGNGYVQILAQHSGKCLDVVDASTVNGARLVQWPCGTGANQRFQRRAA